MILNEKVYNHHILEIILLNKLLLNQFYSTNWFTFFYRSNKSYQYFINMNGAPFTEKVVYNYTTKSYQATLIIDPKRPTPAYDKVFKDKVILSYVHQ